MDIANVGSTGEWHIRVGQNRDQEGKEGVHHIGLVAISNPREDVGASGEYLQADRRQTGKQADKQAGR